MALQHGSAAWLCSMALQHGSAAGQVCAQLFLMILMKQPLLMRLTTAPWTIYRWDA